MPKLELIKLSGWTFIAGAFAFLTILTGSDPIAIPGSVISTLLLVSGMLSLRAGYGETLSRLGRNMLLLGVIGPILLCIIIASMAMIYSTGNLTDTDVETKGLWIVIFGGPAFSLPGLTLFGLDALRSKPRSHLNWLPFFAGIWYPIVYFFMAGYLFTHSGEFPQEYYSAIQIMLLMQFLALCAFGFVLLTATNQEMATG